MTTTPGIEKHQYKIPRKSLPPPPAPYIKQYAESEFIQAPIPAPVPIRVELEEHLSISTLNKPESRSALKQRSRGRRFKSHRRASVSSGDIGDMTVNQSPELNERPLSVSPKPTSNTPSPASCSRESSAHPGTADTSEDGSTDDKKSAKRRMSVSFTEKPTRRIFKMFFTKKLPRVPTIDPKDFLAKYRKDIVSDDQEARIRFGPRDRNGQVISGSELLMHTAELVYTEIMFCCKLQMFQCVCCRN